MQQPEMGTTIVGNGTSNGQAVSSLFPAMRFSWEIKSVDAVFCNGVARLNDLSKEAIIQAIKEQDLRFLTVRLKEIFCYMLLEAPFLE